MPWMSVISDLNCKKIGGTLSEKELQKKKKKKYSNSFNSWFDKKETVYKMSYFTEPYTHSKNKSEVELDLSNYEK